MSDELLISAVLATVALAVALLAWLAIEVGTSTLARYRAQFTERARFQAQEFFLFIDPQKLFLANAALLCLGTLLAWMLTGTLLIAMSAFLGLALLPRGLYAWMRRRRLRRFEEQLPDALQVLAGGLRAGSSLSAAIAQLVSEAQAPLAQEFALLVREQRLGVTMEQSLANLARRVPTQTTVLLVSAMRIASETGGGLAETLERAAHTVRSRLQMEGKIDALTAQGKLQAWVVGALPLVLMLILDRMEPEAMGLLWHSRLGWATLVVVALLEFMGVYLIRRITHIDV